MIPYQLTLEISLEQVARWELAADRCGMGLVEWILDTCQVASDPESGADISALRTGVTTATHPWLWPGASADEADYSVETP